jgi:DNA polymerase
MQLITLDFETYYDKATKYSLSAMGTDEYILDARFQAIGLSIKVNNGAPMWMSGTHEQIANWLAGFDWGNSAVCCHNTLFDGFIMTQIFGIKPKLWMDTLAMGRAAMPWLASHSLDALAQHLGLGKKGHEVIAADGKRREDFTDSELAAYGGYCSNDVHLTYEIAQKLLPITPALELRIVDMTIRMFTEPTFVGDQKAMHGMYCAEVARKEELLLLADTDRETIMSNDKFAQKLLSLGVTPPKKWSARTGKEAWAFAKTDKAFSALLEHPDTEVQALAAARLGVKTTIAETRALRFFNMSQRGPLPVYLNYWGAKTTGRMSGGNGTNWQNLSARGPSAGLRNAIMAPPGHTVVVGDSSNIELRVAMAVAGEQSVLDLIATGADLYCEFASKIYGRPITKADKIERMLGKIAMLSLQYGAGAERFLEMVRLEMAKAGIKSTLDLEAATNIVQLYRNTYHRVPALWKYCEKTVIPAIYNQDYMKGVDVNGWALTDDLGFSVPGSPGVVYHGLREENGSWMYTMGRLSVGLYGGKLVENLCQYLARMIVMWQTARINQRYRVVLSVHDEAVCVVPDDQVAECEAYMTECLTMAPPWCKGLPLACEVAHGPSYGEAK